LRLAESHHGIPSNQRHSIRQTTPDHTNINTTLIYTHLIDVRSDEFTVRVAKTIDEAKELLEVGFEYVTDMDDIKLLRKRKQSSGLQHGVDVYICKLLYLGQSISFRKGQPMRSRENPIGHDVLARLLDAEKQRNHFECEICIANCPTAIGRPHPAYFNAFLEKHGD
jgi:hypothetical protein